MKLLLAVVIALAVTPLAFAACPNSCSGHGTCGAHDKCSCYANWGDEPDCSTKTCPHGEAWVDVSSGTNDAHNYAVCSNKGSCDSKSGECSCFDGYEGKACQRSTCPNDCSGHGTCHTIGKLADDSNCAWNGATQSLGTNCVHPAVAGYSADSVTYTSWDANKIQGCRCDAGWDGADCSSRLCPLGDDILTTCTQGTTADQVNHVSFVEVIAPAWTTNNTVEAHGGALHDPSCTPPSSLAKSQNQPSFVLNFVDQYNKVWTTRPIPVKRLGVESTVAQPAHRWQQNSSAEIKAALEELPNGAVPEVTVDVYQGKCQDTEALTCDHNTNSGAALVNRGPGCGAINLNITRGIQHQWYKITFAHGANSGSHRNKLSCEWKGCTLTGNHDSSVDTRQAHDNTGGCSPYYNGLGAHYGNNQFIPFQSYFDTLGIPLCRVYDDTATGNDVWDTANVPVSSGSNRVVAGDKERAVCSSRGICNTEEGLCECFDGFRGEACEEQLALS